MSQVSICLLFQHVKQKNCTLVNMQSLNFRHVTRISRRFCDYPWRALKRGFFLLITYKRPRRRTTWQLRSRDFKVFNELATFIFLFLSFVPALFCQSQNVPHNRQSELKDQVLICFNLSVLGQVG